MSSKTGNDMMKSHMMLIESINNSESEEATEATDYEETYFDLPSHWGSALVNGDYTGVSEEDEEEILEFLKENPMAHWITGDVEELGFESRNDANKLGGDVSRFHAFKKLDEADLSESEDSEHIDQAKKEIEKESDLAKKVAEEHGQSLDAVYFMTWFVDEVAKKLKAEGKIEENDEPLEEKDLNMGVVHSKYDFKKHIANNFSHYQDNIRRLYPSDQKAVYGIFLKFLKEQELSKEEVQQVANVIEKKIREVGDEYDEMASFLDTVSRFI